jgi:broad specificity phosphatase PhoE
MVLSALLALALLIPGAEALCAQDGPVFVYVVRHAERADDGLAPDRMLDDPPLSEAGRARARQLAELLRGVDLTGVHSTDYERTRSTAQPLSAAHGLELEIYDAGDIGALAERLRASPGTHVVVGHSNTGPALVEALGAEPGSPIDALEYDRVYVVVVLPGGATGSAVFRYGSPYRGTP